VTTMAAAEQLIEGGIDVQPGQATFFLDLTDRQAPTLTVGLKGTTGFITWWDGSLRAHPQTIRGRRSIR